MNKKTFFIIVAVAIVVVALIGIISAQYFKNSENTVVPPAAENNLVGDENKITAKFFCDGDKTIDAVFNNGASSSVDLILSDGRSLSLPQVISASGARYANADESFVFWNKGDGAFIEENATTTFDNCSTKTTEEDTTSIANPASTNCVQQGGKSTIQTKEDGSQYSLCYFDDARACEEWAMFRGECPVGGVKTTGYDTIEQKYCAWVGGKTLAVANATCTFSDNSTCSVVDLYSGACRKGDSLQK